jgi:chitinase
MSFSTYVTYWDSDPYNTIQNMINCKALSVNSRVILAFASFNFSSTNYIPGFGNLTIDNVKSITNLVHNNNMKISLSIGGATYPFTGSDLYSQPGLLASNICSILNTCGFDGVDFDIEDPATGYNDDYINNTSSLINSLKNLNPNLYITLTTAAQAWAPGMWQPIVLNNTINNLSYWQPMEYDIWIQTSYYNQIMSDINYYHNNWSIPYNKMVLGLMPGSDDMGHNLSLQDALNLTSFAKLNGMGGVMTWDANIDSNGIDNNAPFAYCMGIQSLLYNNNN